jgi:hypothetical protein
MTACLQINLSDRREELLKREARKIMNDPSHPLHTRLFKSNIPMIYGQLVAKTHYREPKDINVPS